MPVKDILELEEARCQAMIDADVKVLGRLLDDELIWTHASGHVDDRAGFLAKLSGASMRYLTMTRSDEQVRLSGSSAVVTGRVAMEVIIAGQQRSLSNRYTDVWVQRRDDWRMLAWQSTPVPSP